MTESTSKKTAHATAVMPPLMFNVYTMRTCLAMGDWCLPKLPLPGMVGCFTADRALPWDMYVVISYDTDTNMITAICPRIRVDADDSVKLGVDKMTETYERPASCTCSPPRQGDDFCCNCGAYEAIRKHYTLTFAEAEADLSYKTMEFEHVENRKEFSFVYLQWLGKSEINDLDYPMTIDAACHCVRI